MYEWLWKRLLHLPQPISWLIVHSIKAHLLIWDIIGSILVSGLWILTMHFIKMT